MAWSYTEHATGTTKIEGYTDPQTQEEHPDITLKGTAIHPATTFTPENMVLGINVFLSLAGLDSIYSCDGTMQNMEREITEE